jgi:hypothetical protein
MSTQTLKSNQAQASGDLRLSFEELTENEQQLVSFLGEEGRPVYTIKEMMEGLGWHLGRSGRARGNSKVRNTLRRLVRSHWVGHQEEIGDGKYRITLQGLNRLKKLAESVETTTAKPKKHRPKTEPGATKEQPAEVKEALAVLAEHGVTVTTEAADEF